MRFITLHSAIDREEGELLARLIRGDEQVRRTLEIGCAYGLSSLFICEALNGRSGARHTIVDPFQNRDWDGVGVANLRRAGFDFFDLIEERSEFALPRLLQEGEARFDMIFVDGWHTFDHALVDCFYATRLLRAGGCLVVDDVSFASVSRVAAHLATYPCYREVDAVGVTVSPSWKRRALRLAMSRGASFWKRTLSRTWNERLFSDRDVRMIALQKISEDNRNWNWHDDAF